MPEKEKDKRELWLTNARDVAAIVLVAGALGDGGMLHGSGDRMRMKRRTE